ncbi:MAG: type II secretion system F family protein [Candidatus Aenigmarchaeota archaeon]|nr:type II secretion system F family protein [Candidatus Aenigmarchaeota archaeon]
MYLRKIEEVMRFCDITIDPKKFLNFYLLFSFGLSFSVSLFFLSTSFYLFLFILVVVFIFSQLFLYFILLFIADTRARIAEDNLVDALLLISANIRSGLTIDRVFLLSARPEFGPLGKEISNAANESLTGKPIEEAMMNIPKKLKSELIEKTFKLIAEGIRSGGELAGLLERTALDIKELRNLKKEVEASVLMYGIFILFACVFGVPLLYGVSTYLLETMLKFSPSLGLREILTGSLSPTTPRISSDFLFLFSLTAITITNFFGSLAFGLIKEGDKKFGIKIFPIVSSLSIAIFIGVRFFIRQMFGALF